MRKIRLALDSLAVESFPIAEAAVRPAGTVRAHEADPVPTLHTGYHGCYACPATLVCAADVPTLDTGYHGCYGCLGSGLPTCAACS